MIDVCCVGSDNSGFPIDRCVTLNCTRSHGSGTKSDKYKRTRIYNYLKGNNKKIFFIHISMCLCVKVEHQCQKQEHHFYGNRSC